MSKKLVLVMLINILCVILVCAQNKGDLNYGNGIISKVDSSNVFLNHNNYSLQLSEREAYVIAKRYLVRTYGYWKVTSQKPHNIILIDDKWVLYGTAKKGKKGGVFEIVINSHNGKIEYLSHGK